MNKTESESFSSNSSGQLDVLGHDGDSLGMNGTEIGVFKESNEICLTGLLKGQNRAGLESQFSLVIMSNFSH